MSGCLMAGESISDREKAMIWKTFVWLGGYHGMLLYAAITNEHFLAGSLLLLASLTVWKLTRKLLL